MSLVLMGLMYFGPYPEYDRFTAVQAGKDIKIDWSLMNGVSGWARYNEERNLDAADTTSGYAFIDIAVMKNRYGPSASSPEDTFSILWVGAIEHLAAMSKDGSYSTRLAEFLETNFGIPRRP